MDRRQIYLHENGQIDDGYMNFDRWIDDSYIYMRMDRQMMDIFGWMNRRIEDRYILIDGQMIEYLHENGQIDDGYILIDGQTIDIFA